MPLVSLLLVGVPSVRAEATSTAGVGRWEFRVCATPNNYPASSRERPGYENRITEILADELGAEATFEWTTFDQQSVLRTLHAGKCDAIVGIGEGVAGVESTVPFLRAPFTFVTLAQDDIQVESLDDPRLASLTVGTYMDGLAALALSARGLEDNVREYAPLQTPSGPDYDAAVLSALISGAVDVAIVYGPGAAARAEDEPGLLRIEPVTPEVDVGPSIIQMFRIRTIGVRPQDVDFRDRLNAALAARWEEIQAAIDDYGVHQLEVTSPPPLPEPDPGTVNIGVIVPSKTHENQPYEIVGNAAQRGAEYAENYVARDKERRDIRFKVFIANAPTDEAAVRAAERLAVTENVVALVGGFGRTQALDLARIVAERELVFFNIAAPDDDLRGELCRPTTFHVAASASMYADAALEWYAAQGVDEWYLVHEATPAGESLAEHLRKALNGSSEPRLVGRSAVKPHQFVYVNEIQEIRSAEPEGVLLQLEADELDQFYAQLAGQGLGAVVTAIPDVRAQTRDFLYRFRQAAQSASNAARPALWDASLDMGEAGEVNQGYASRTGDPMESSAWAAYTAVLLTFEAAATGAASDSRSLIDFLSGPEVTFDVDLGKGSGLSFRSWDHQLRQPLFMVQVDPEAQWGRRLSARLAFAEVVAMIPEVAQSADLRTALDRLGVGPEETDCEF